MDQKSPTGNKHPRKVLAAEAISALRAGQRVILGDGCGEPQTLGEALLADRRRLQGLEIVNGFHVATPHAYAQPDSEGYHLRLNSWMAGPRDRQALAAGMADYLPCHVSEYHELLREGRLPLDAVLLQVSPPDEEGYCSLGVTVDYLLDAVALAPLVIAEVNEQMPYVQGETRLHLSQFDYLVEVSRPLLEMPSPKIGPAEDQVGQNVAQLVPDGGTIQFGVGTIPEAVLRALGEKRELGIHSGMLSEGVVDLMERGVVTNARKAIDPGVTVATCLLGTERLYRFAHRNPRIALYPSSYTHNLRVIGQLRDFVSINAALQVDLTGQVNAESLGLRQVSGVGGQADFVRGAHLCEGGRAITALTSTTPDGKASRIVPVLPLGSAVTTPRHEVQYVVTEYGIADLRGKNLGQRREALVAIAHPDSRERILKEHYELRSRQNAK